MNSAPDLASGRNLFVNQSANERTFLSWIRTVLSIVAVALVIGKLALDGQTSVAEMALTDACAGGGVLVILAATFRYLKIRHRIRTGLDPDYGLPILDVSLAVAVVIMIAALAATRFV